MNAQVRNVKSKKKIRNRKERKESNIIGCLKEKTETFFIT